MRASHLQTCNVDDLYKASCAHEQKAQCLHVVDIVVVIVDGRGYDGQQKLLFVMLVDRAKQFKAHSSQFFQQFQPINHT